LIYIDIGTDYYLCSMLNSNEARNESLLLIGEDSLDNSTAEETKANRESMLPRPSTTGSQNEILVDPIHRPIWMESKDACKPSDGYRGCQSSDVYEQRAC